MRKVSGFAVLICLCLKATAAHSDELLDEVILHAKEAVKTGTLFTIPNRCLSFEPNPNSDLPAPMVEIEINEIHGGSRGCPGDPSTAPRAGVVKVDGKSGQVWELDEIANRWLPLRSPAPIRDFVHQLYLPYSGEASIRHDPYDLAITKFFTPTLADLYAAAAKCGQLAVDPISEQERYTVHIKDINIDYGENDGEATAIALQLEDFDNDHWEIDLKLRNGPRGWLVDDAAYQGDWFRSYMPNWVTNARSEGKCRP